MKLFTKNRGNVNMQSIKNEKWQDLEHSKTLSNLYAYAYSSFVSGMEVAKFFRKKNIGMYTNAFNKYENILFERKHKMPSWKSDKFRSLSQPLINIIKRDTKITRTTKLKNAINSYEFRTIIGKRHHVFKTHIDILKLLGLIGISQYYKSEIRNFKKIKIEDIKKTKIRMRELDDKIISEHRIWYGKIDPEHTYETIKDLNKIDIDTIKKLKILYPEHEAILSGVKYSLLYYLSLTKK
jgi:hypothetical protein